ncbi:Herc2 [Symbiodinium necroappetens]|uniref:Herc2 protein n=1 Tax=Symbiodinium necroappetens TaxID=1628268 RepID=A0A812V8Y4_9DINO|nr:Herc2 [Symbiodinium necroappetens]
MSVQDVCNVRNDTPLFALFTFEDWVLVNLRAELSLLTLAFLQDAADPERVGIHESNLGFYYQKYFKKSLLPKQYGMNTNMELVEKLVKDTVDIAADTQVLTSKRTQEELGDFSILVKLTEAARRDRQRKLDSGDESVRLQLDVQAHMPPPPPQQQMVPHYQGGGGGFKGYGNNYGMDKGGYKGDKGGFKGYKGDRGFKGGFKGDGGYGKDFGKDGYHRAFDKGKKGGDNKGYGKKGKDGKPGKGY